MISPEFTYLFCLDEKRGYFNEVRKRFNDGTRYEVVVITGRHEFLNTMESYSHSKGFKVAIIPYEGSRDQNEAVRHLAAEARLLIPELAIILLAPADATGDIVSKSGIAAYSWVPSTNNAVLRIHNSVKKLISEKILAMKARRRNRAFRVLLFFVFLSLLVLLYSRLRYPSYF